MFPFLAMLGCCGFSFRFGVVIKVEINLNIFKLQSLVDSLQQGGDKLTERPHNYRMHPLWKGHRAKVTWGRQTQYRRVTHHSLFVLRWCLIIKARQTHQEILVSQYLLRLIDEFPWFSLLNLGELGRVRFFSGRGIEYPDKDLEHFKLVDVHLWTALFKKQGGYLWETSRWLSQMSFEVVKKLNELRLLEVFGEARVVDWGEDSLPTRLEMTEQVLIQVLRLFLA